MNSNYIYDETQQGGHGFSFSHKLEHDLISPKNRKPNNSRLEKIDEPFSSRNNLHKSSQRGGAGRGFDLSPELTLDDLREKLKADNSKKTDEYETFKTSSLNHGQKHTQETLSLESKTLTQSISPKGRNIVRESSESYHYQPYSSKNYKSPVRDGLLSSPQHTYTQSMSSYMKSPTRSVYNNGEFSDRQSLKTLNTNYYEPEHSLKHSRSLRSNPTLVDVIRSRSSTPKKDKFGFNDTTKLHSTNYLGGSTYLLNSANENSQSLQQELKAKIEQFNKKLVEVQEGFSQSKSSQDPYQISLRSLKPLPNEELLDGSLNKKAARSNFGDENSKNLSNKDEKSQPLYLDNLTKSENNGSNGPKDYTQKFQQMKLKYSDMFKPQEMKTMANPYKILRHRYDNKLDNLVKGYLEQTTSLQSEIDRNLFNANVN